MSQTEFPALPLSKALAIAKALWDNFAGKGAAPHQIALALNLSPTSGSWRASIADGLTQGGYNANEITLTPLGRRIVAPTAEGDDVVARSEAILKPRIMKEFLEKYDKAKFPADTIAQNVLISLGLPRERAASAVEILKENGKHTGILKDTKTGLFVAIDSPMPPPETHAEEDIERGRSDEEAASIKSAPSGKESGPGLKEEIKSNRVYISHGKNRQIVEQLKQLLTFGKFEPIVSVEKESSSIPVPEKVFEDMRSCAAGVIHVMSEGELLDPEGKKRLRINENVLIEIGAAIALYGKKFVLLVEKGVKLPSNLQGLYECSYEGDKLDYDATMKLLKIFNTFH